MRKSLFILGSLGILIPSFVFGEIFLSVTDHPAGSSVPIIASGLTANENVRFLIGRPDKTTLEFQEKADEWGRVSTDIFGMHVEKAGTYSFTAIGELSGKKEKSFVMAPEKVSAFRSQISIEKSSLPADGKTMAVIHITLKDEYNNLVTQQPVKVFSSRNEDTIISATETGEDGKIVAKISSSIPGVSTLSVLAGDEVLYEKPEIVFFLDGKDLPPNAGQGSLGDFLKAQLFTDPKETHTVTRFVIEGLTSEVKKGENLTFRVDAVDSNGVKVPNYVGTIRFSSSDDRAKLPNDYTFTAEDQGSHTFYIALTFGTLGDQTLAVHDLGDFRISGEFKLKIAENNEGVIAPETNPSIRILMPADGSRFSTPRVTVTGDAVECTVAKLFDGPTLLIDNLAIDSSQSFLYQTPTLADGWHEFQAICALDEKVISNKVRILIDRQAPSAMSVRLEPSGPIQPEQEFQIFIGAAEPLSKVSALLNGIEIPFETVDEKTYVAKIKSPKAPGEYPFSATITDMLGNQLEELNAGTISVIPRTEPVTEPPVTPPEEGVGGPPEEPKEVKDETPPSAVSNLSAKSGEEGKVTLFWSPAKDDGGIGNYIVNYSLCEQGMGLENSVPDDRTQWYIDNLLECEKYCFQITALDKSGNKGTPSEIVEGSAFCSQSIHEAAPKTAKTGGSTPWWIFAIAVVAGAGVMFVARKRQG